MSTGERLRQLPAVSAVLETNQGKALADSYGRAPAVDAIREATDQIRQRILSDEEPGEDLLASVLTRADAILTAAARQGLRPVINATGVIVHTNLGRSILSEHAARAVYDISRVYNNLEANLDEGRRSSRHVHIESRLRTVIGAEAGAVFNNNAAAVMLALASVAEGREVIISRGQLIEIGGSFRIPDVIERSGCILREVGATNRTHLADYERAINENTAAILRAHPSNYRIVGFTKEPAVEELVDLAHRKGIVFIDDIGSGALVDLSVYGVGEEPMPAWSLAAGADIVTFSGDKLLGGPQCGFAVGKADAIERMKRHPLARAVRVGKMTIAAVAATLDLFADPERALREVPTLRAATEPIDVVRERAEGIADGLRADLPPGVEVSLVRDRSARVGGGSLPEQDLETVSVRVRPAEGLSPNAVAKNLRTGAPSVYPRLADNAVVLDARTILPNQVADVVKAVHRALRVENSGDDVDESKS